MRSCLCPAPSGAGVFFNGGIIMELMHGDALRQKMMGGINKLADAVKVTLGPLGRNVALHQKANVRGADYSDAPAAGAHVLITNDGVTIAKSIVLADPAENLGVQLLREAAVKTNDVVGDGTTTAIVLAQDILQGAFRNIAAGAESMAVRRGLQKAGERAAKALLDAAQPIATEEEIAHVASISCEDEELGAMIAQAIYRVGREGVINIDDSKKTETTLDIQEGIVFEKGFISPVMATDGAQTEAVLRDPYILICDTNFTNPQDILPFLILAAEDERDALVICDGAEGSVLGLIARNKTEGDMNIVCVQAPLYGEGRRWRMEDLAVQTGGAFITKELGMDIRNVTRDMVGTAAYVRVTKNQTIITGGGGDPAAVESRIAELRHIIETTDYEFNRERYRERLAKFVSGVAKIDVGGRTEPEIWEKKMRVEDAVNASRAACEEGVVPGGGIALLDLAPMLFDFADTLSGDEKTGARILAEAVQIPARQILDNAGRDGKSLTASLRGKRGQGIDVFTGRETDMLAAGVFDPVKVTRLALENAVSVASTVLTAEAGTEKKEPKAKETAS